MITRQSNNILPNIRVICRGDRGENHAFPGVAAYVMECIGNDVVGNFTGDFNERLWFFEGLSADILSPVYSFTGYQGWSRSDYLYSKDFIIDIFNKCGYACSYISPDEFNSNKEMYLLTIMAYIDKGVPVIIRKGPHDECTAIIGYEDYGKTLIYIDVNNTKEIHKMTVEKNMNISWVFIGEKLHDINIAEIYKNMILELPEVFNQRSDTYCFGANAFNAWADEIEKGRLELWDVYHINFLTMAACSHNVFDKILELNPNMIWVREVSECYNKCRLWSEQDEKDTDPKKWARIAGYIRNNAEQMNEVIKIIQNVKLIYAL